MRRATMLLLATVMAPVALAAQSPNPANCTKDATDWYTTAAKAARDSAGLVNGKAPNLSAVYSALLTTRTAKIKACAAQFSVSAMSGPDLLALATLYSSIGDDSLASRALDKRLAEPNLSETDRAGVLVARINALTKPDTLVIARAEPYMAQLDAMSSAVLMQKLDAHSRLNGEYRYLDVNDRIRHHSRAIIDLTRSLKAVPSSARDAAGVRSYTILGAYSNLSEVYGDFGQADSALAILRQATVDHPEISAADADSYLKSGFERYALVGKPAMPIQGGHWLNAPPDTRAMEAKGKVTVIEFTAHWCIPCRNSYPAMADMAEKFGKQGVQFIFATEFYGYLGTKRPLDAAGEFEADQEYFVGEHGIHFPIAIEDQRPPYQAGQPFPNTLNNDHYKVGGIPQTVIIDKNGNIRRILTGWDTGNAQRMPVLLAALLKEKPTRLTPQ